MCCETHTIVLDSQGSDSIEAGDAGKTFDRRTATFVMALSGAVIVNCNFKDIGRHEGSQLSLLRQIIAVQHELMSGADPLDEFESIDLSSCSSSAAPSELAPRRKRTLLLFVIRDYPTGEAAPPLEPIGAMLQEHIVEAWMSANRQNTADLAAHFNTWPSSNPHEIPSASSSRQCSSQTTLDPQVERSSVESSSDLGAKCQPSSGTVLSGELPVGQTGATMSSVSTSCAKWRRGHGSISTTAPLLRPAPGCPEGRRDSSPPRSENAEQLSG